MNEEDLKHSGTKGMKWGVIKWRKSSGEPRKPGRIKQELDSLKRERSWKKVVANVHNLTTKDIGTISKRAGLENELKRLSKTSGDKKNYRLRAKMSDQELNRKVARLRAIHSITSQSDAATKKQRDLGKRIAQTGGSIALKVYLASKNGKSVTVGDIFESAMNPKGAQAQAGKLILDMVFKKKS